MDFMEPGSAGVSMHQSVSRERLAEFENIKQEYNAFYFELLRKGRAALKNTKDGYWGISQADLIWEVFNKIKLDKFKNFFDIGSGDGKVVLAASLFTKATGFETDTELFKKSAEMKKKLGLKNAFLYKKDYYTENLSKYDVLYHFPDQPMHKLERKLLAEMKGILIHYGNEFKPLQLREQQRFVYKGVKVTIYRNIN